MILAGLVFWIWLEHDLGAARNHAASEPIGNPSGPTVPDVVDHTNTRISHFEPWSPWLELMPELNAKGTSQTEHSDARQRTASK